MLKVQNLSLPLAYTQAELTAAICKVLGVHPGELANVTLARRSVDARKKHDVHFSVTANVELKRPYRRALPKHVAQALPYRYELPQGRAPAMRPVVVGAGPAGLFAALSLARAGFAPLLLERGKPVEERAQDVARFWQTGALDITSNVQFGEGGAGTFSDGKLNTGTKDPRARFVLETFVACGAPEQILYDAKPHVGTDRLRGVVAALRREMLRLGAEVRFNSQVTGIIQENGCLCGLTVWDGERNYTVQTRHAILALGHSARDTFKALYEQGLYMQQKPFSVGARIEHLQSEIDRAQYGSFAGHPALGAADYKLAVRTKEGRGVYTFCMCPGGSVVAAASEEGRVVTNGMSEFARAGQNANAALLVGIGPEDFGSAHPLAGMWLQRKIEADAFALAGGGYRAPAQLVGDFLAGRPSGSFGTVRPTYERGVKLTDIARCLPDPVVRAMREGIGLMERSLHGFAALDALLTAPETRSSSPVRIVRDETQQSVSLRGLYPCGEGAGYAGGIVSAAVDGLRCAESLIAGTEE